MGENKKSEKSRKENPKEKIQRQLYMGKEASQQNNKFHQISMQVR